MECSELAQFFHGKTLAGWVVSLPQASAVATQSNDDCENEPSIGTDVKLCPRLFAPMGVTLLWKHNQVSSY